MSNIAISDLHTTGSDLFSDSESYLNDLDNNEIEIIKGGLTPALVWSVVTAASRLSSVRCGISVAAWSAGAASAVSGWITGGK